MEPVHEETHKGYTIKIFQDEDAEDPRELDNLGTMVCFHKRYRLGDTDHDVHHPDELVLHDRPSGGVIELPFAEFMKSAYVISLPLYLFDHSGITMSTTCEQFRAFDAAGWDWGQVGWIYVTKMDVRAERGWKHITRERVEKIEEHLRGEVKVYDQYLTGNVYGYMIEDADEEHVDSCWGFFGDPEGYPLEQARETVDAIATRVA